MVSHSLYHYFNPKSLIRHLPWAWFSSGRLSEWGLSVPAGPPVQTGSPEHLAATLQTAGLVLRKD